MNHMEDAILNKLLRLIETKTGWGKNELKDAIVRLACDEISRLPSVRSPAPIAPKPQPKKEMGDDLTPCPHISLDELPSQKQKQSPVAKGNLASYLGIK